MKLVAAKKPDGKVRFDSLRHGQCFRMTEGCAVLVKLHHDEVYVAGNIEAGFYCQGIEDGQMVIPAPVLLVEKGADIDEVKAALESL